MDAQEKAMTNTVYRLIREEQAQDLIEYSLLVAVLSIGFVLMIQALANGVLPFFDRVTAVLESL